MFMKPYSETCHWMPFLHWGIALPGEWLGRRSPPLSSGPPARLPSLAATGARRWRRARTVAVRLLLRPFPSPAKLLCWFRRSSWRGTSADSASGTGAGRSTLPPPRSALPRPDLLSCLPCRAPLCALRGGGGAQPAASGSTISAPSVRLSRSGSKVVLSGFHRRLRLDNDLALLGSFWLVKIINWFVILTSQKAGSARLRAWAGSLSSRARYKKYINIIFVFI
jgi:hypothetical protein